MRILATGAGISTERLALGAAGALWLYVCAKAITRVLNHPDKTGIAFAVACIVLPLVVLHFKRMPVYIFAAYAALVPFSSLLGTSGGATLTKLIGVAAGGALVLSMLAKCRAVPPSKSLLAVLALTIYAGLTVCWAIDGQTALSAYGIYLSYAGLYIVVALYPATDSEARLILYAAMAGAIVSALYGGYLFMNRAMLFESRLSIGLDDINWIDPNEYAANLLIPIAIMFMAAMRWRGLYAKAGAFAILLVLFYGFAASGSRGGMFALGAMLVFLMLRSKYRLQLLAMIPLIAIALMSSSVGYRLTQADVLSGDLRTDIWSVGLASLQQYWLAGAGIGNFSNAFAQYFLAVPHAALSWDRVAHSILVQSAVEYGVPGLLLVLAVWYTQFVELRSIPQGDRMGGVALALQAGIVGLFVSGLTLSLMGNKVTWLTFSLIALTRSARLATRQSDENRRLASRTAELPSTT